MARKFRNILKFCILIFPFVTYLFYLWNETTSTVSFLSFWQDSYGAYGSWFLPLIESILGENSILPLLDSTAVSYVSLILGYFVVYSVVILIYDVFAFIPAIMSRWLDKFKKE